MEEIAMLISFSCESSSIEECIKEINQRAIKTLENVPGYINSAKIALTFGAFMNLSVLLSVGYEYTAKKQVVATFSSGRNKEDAIQRVIDAFNLQIPRDAKIVEFEVKTYTTPVTRRTYAVGVVVFNVPVSTGSKGSYTLKERRDIIRDVLRIFNYNPKVLNISELARFFGVSRDSIYYDIQQILKEAKKGQSR
jgi:hypothetical protein